MSLSLFIALARSTSRRISKQCTSAADAIHAFPGCIDVCSSVALQRTHDAKDTACALDKCSTATVVRNCVWRSKPHAVAQYTFAMEAQMGCRFGFSSSKIAPQALGFLESVRISFEPSAFLPGLLFSAGIAHPRSVEAVLYSSWPSSTVALFLGVTNASLFLCFGSSRNDLIAASKVEFKSGFKQLSQSQEQFYPS